MSRRRRLAAVGVLAAGGAVGLLWAQEQAPAGGQKPTFRVEANFVRVDVFPSADGRPVTDLAATDFEVKEDGVLQKVETFERIDVPIGATSDRREPNSTRESRTMAENPRSRVFVVFLDTYHTEITASHRIRRAMVSALERIVGPEDVFAVMTPEMSVMDLAFARRTDTIEAILSKYWFWGRQDRITDRDPQEESYYFCYPNTGETAGLAREMVARRREKRSLDALDDLAISLRGIREERKAVLVVTSGWLLFRPSKALTALPPRNIPTVGTGPTGQVTADRDRSYGYESQATCEADRQRLADLDNFQTFMDLLDRANRSNVSFYPIDARGLAAWDQPLGPEPPPPPSVDAAMLRTRVEFLRSLAENTDGLAVVLTNDIDRGLKRVMDDLTSYYLLGYYSTNTKLDGKFRSISVKVKRPGVAVRARRGYLAATEDEIRVGREAAASAAAAATPVMVQAALGSIASYRPGLPWRSRVAVAMTGADRARVWVTGELDATLSRSADWAGGGEVEVIVAQPAGGAPLAQGNGTLSGGRRSVTVELPDVAVPEGEWVVRTRLRPAQGGLPLLDTQRLPARATAPTLLEGAPRLFRRGPTTGLEYQPAADSHFRRTERIRLEQFVAGTPGEVAGEILDQRGQPLGVPVVVTTRDDAALGGQWVVADVQAAQMAPADYVLRLKVSAREALVGLRITP